MVGTRCRVAFLQYLPKKPTKFGIKIWINSEAKTGYVVNFEIYTGKTTGKEKGLGYRVVMDIMKPYYFKGQLSICGQFLQQCEIVSRFVE